jgi:hypothetical protein
MHAAGGAADQRRDRMTTRLTRIGIQRLLAVGAIGAVAALAAGCGSNSD